MYDDSIPVHHIWKDIYQSATVRTAFGTLGDFRTRLLKSQQLGIDCFTAPQHCGKDGFTIRIDVEGRSLLPQFLRTFDPP